MYQQIQTRIRSNRMVVVCCLLAGGVALAHVSFAEIGNPMGQKVALSTRPFNLEDVRLLDSPLKHAQDLDHDYLLKLEPDRLLAWYRKEAGLLPKAEVYGGWESAGVAGHSLGHYLSACAEMYAATGDERLRERVSYVVTELAQCQQANGNGFVAAFPNGKQIFAELAHGEIRSQGFDLNGGWVPFYTIHKELAGLRDAYRLCGNTNAMTVAVKLADFLNRALANLNYGQMQMILACEHGGMNEVLADLYVDTGDSRYLNLAQRFYHEAVMQPLVRGVDQLNGLHANTQIPKLIGLARLYELTSDTNNYRAVKFFWEQVVRHHSYVTGGNGLDEHLGPPDKLSDRLGPNTTETCNVYNMLKLTRHLFSWEASAEAMDFYERALYNHILASQHPTSGEVVYNLTLQMGGTKRYQTQFNSFTCCVGTGMENHALYGAGIYFHTTNSLYVNLYIPSELRWREQGVTLRQETQFPDADQTVLQFACERPVRFTLHVRRPYWAGAGFEVKVNGHSAEFSSSPSSFVSITREWRAADRVEITLPRTLHLQAMPDNPSRVAVMYGPLVLAGQLGPENDPNASEPDYVPVLMTGNRAPTDWLKPVPGQSGVFRMENGGRPRDVELLPFFRIHNRNYAVFWDIFTPEQWQLKETAYAADRKRQYELEARTVDFFQPGEMQPERDHQLKGERTRSGNANGRKWRDAEDGGWFSWQMTCDSGQKQMLTLTYWGSDSNGRVFDVSVEQEKIATQSLDKNRPGSFFDVTYDLPEGLTRGKTNLTVKLKAHPSQMAGGLFGARLFRAKASSASSDKLFQTNVPGVVISHLLAKEGRYVGSPSLVELSDGSYVTSHDEFGPKSSYRTCAVSRIFRSVNRGQSWQSIAVLSGQFWSTLFQHRGELYLIGTDKEYGNAFIRRSRDGGLTWTTPTNSASGLLRDDGQYHCAPMPVIEHAGRLWRAMERRDPPTGWGINFCAGIFSVSVDADLLNATNWVVSNFLPGNRHWLSGQFRGWLEGNAVRSASGEMFNILRVDTPGWPEKAAIVNVSSDGQRVSFVPETGFIDLPGGAKKFTIRPDPQGDGYWTLATVANQADAIANKKNSHSPASIRNSLALLHSANLRQWDVRRTLLHHRDLEKHGFQYVDWLFDGDDLIAVCRTAYEDGLGGAHNNHDANFLTFHRIQNFRKMAPAKREAGLSGSNAEPRN